MVVASAAPADNGHAMRRRLDRKLALGLGLATLLVALSACKEQSSCDKACRRVAMCKTLAIEGEPILGEKAPPPDKACMKKCQNHPDDFAKCEGRTRVCRELRNCRGSWR